MKSIGGYFELELPQEGTMEREGILVNTGRNALEYILRVRGYRHVYIPYYTCEVVLEPLDKLGVSYSFYHVGRNLEVIEYPVLKEDEALLYTNYFGLMDNVAQSLEEKYGDKLIIDNAQAYFADISVGDQFFSPRKFFGIPDGGVVVMNTQSPFEEMANLEQDISYQRMEHMLMRLDQGAEFGFETFQNSREVLKDQPIRKMSNLTKRLMASVDYESIRKIRNCNFKLLHQYLGTANELELDFDIRDNVAPLVYPFCVGNAAELRQCLFAERIYPAQYWPNVLTWCQEGDVEYDLAKNTLALPIDQRYDEEDMKRIIEVIRG